MNFKIKKYDKKYIKDWNNFLANSKYNHFFFHRTYLEYNKKFEDCSLMFYKNSELIALLPANLSSDKKTLSSHDGLSFAGLIKSKKCNIYDIMSIFENLIDYADKKHIKKIQYKLIPYFYSFNLSESDRYALNYFKFNISLCEISSLIDYRKKFKYSHGMKANLKIVSKFRDNYIVSSDIKYLSSFWSIATSALERFGTLPTHSLNEITFLIENFKSKIKPFFIIDKNNSDVICGVIVYENEHVVHCQYIFSNAYGKKKHLNSYLINYLIEFYKTKKFFFSFGKSTDNAYLYNINKGLLYFKNSFGADEHTFETYTLTL